MKNYLLTETNADVIAIIQDKLYLTDFYEFIKQAIAENLGLKKSDVKINADTEGACTPKSITYTFKVDVQEDGEQEVREYYITELTTY